MCDYCSKMYRIAKEIWEDVWFIYEWPKDIKNRSKVKELLFLGISKYWDWEKLEKRKPIIENIHKIYSHKKTMQDIWNEEFISN